MGCKGPHSSVALSVVSKGTSGLGQPERCLRPLLRSAFALWLSVAQAGTIDAQLHPPMLELMWRHWMFPWVPREEGSEDEHLGVQLMNQPYN